MLAELISHWRSNPLIYAKQVFNLTEFDDWQTTLLRDFPNHNRIAVKSGRGIGKSFMQALLAFYFLSTRPRPKVLITASTESQLQDVVWSECRRLLGLMKPQFRELYDFQITSDKIFPAALEREVFASGKVPRVDRVESIQGFRAPQTLIIADEASALPQNVYQSMLGNLTGNDALEQKFCLFSNPRRMEGPFYDIFAREKHGWKTYTVSSLDSRWCSRELIDEIRIRYGEQSPEYMADVLGEFPVTTRMSVIPKKFVDDALVRVMPTEGDLVWGLDVARGGGDLSALAERTRYKLHGVETFDSDDTTDLIAWVASKYTQMVRKPHRIYVDAIGMGGPIYDRMRELGLPVVSVNVATTIQTDTLKYPRLRDQLWFSLRDWIQTAQIDCKDDNLIEELVRVQYDYKKDGRSELVSKRESVGRSPDRADALALTMFHRESSIMNIRPTMSVMDSSYGAQHDPGQFRFGFQSEYGYNRRHPSYL